jgi:molybdopterin converting factor small subunit
MSAVIKIPTPLRQFTGRAGDVVVTTKTLRAAIEQLKSQFPALRLQLFNDEGKLRSFVNVYLNDEDVRYIGGFGWVAENEHVRATFEHWIGNGDTISIVPSIAGG